MRIMKIKSLVLCLSLAGLGGCSFTSLPGNVKRSINNTESGIDSANQKLANAQTVQHDNYITHTNNIYLSNQVVTLSDADYLPPIFSNQFQIDRQFYGIRQIASGITDLTQIPAIVDLAGSDSNVCPSLRVTQQDGSLIDLLNNIGANCDLGWSYRDGKIVLSDTETKTWPIKGIPGDIQVQNQINNNAGVQGQSGSSGGGSTASTSQAGTNQSTTQNIAFNLQNSLWQNLQDAIKSMLSKDGKISISPSTSSLTVTDRPSVIMRVDRYMKNQNDILKRQVQVDVQVLNVDVEAQDNYGINWNLALKGSNTLFTINGQTVTNGSSGAQVANTPVFIPTNTTQAFTIGATSGSLENSQLVINALSSITKTKLVTSTAVTTLSNQPVPVQFVDQMSYLASVQQTISGQGGISQTSLTPGQITTGFSLNILPVIEADGKVNLQLSLNISSLKNISQYSSGGNSIQLPETLQRNFMQKVVIKSGDTFVVTGFDSDTGNTKNTGVGGAYNWILGGGVSASNIRTRMVVLITPRVVNQ